MQSTNNMLPVVWCLTVIQISGFMSDDG